MKVLFSLALRAPCPLHPAFPQCPLFEAIINLFIYSEQVCPFSFCSDPCYDPILDELHLLPSWHMPVYSISRSDRRSWNGKRETITLKEMKKDLKQPALAPAQSFFGLWISQSPPECITVPLPDSKTAGLGSYHFELLSVSFSSQISKPLEAAPRTFLTSQQLLMSSESSLKTCKQALLPLTARCNHSNTLPRACSQGRNPLKVRRQAALPNPCHPLPSLCAGGSSLPCLSDTHFAQGAEVNGLVTELRSSDIFSVPKKFLIESSSMWYHFSMWDWKPWIQGSFFLFLLFHHPVWTIPSLRVHFKIANLSAMNLVRNSWLCGEKGSGFASQELCWRHTAVDAALWNYLTF